jgi:hypothetical protein
VHSNQLDQSVTASGGGYSKTWHTDSSGCADVYLRGPRSGDQISVHVGGRIVLNDRTRISRAIRTG